MSAPELDPALSPSLSVQVAPSAGLAIGDKFTLTIDAIAKPGIDVAVPEQSLAPFELLDRRASVQTQDGQQKFHFEIDLLALESGKQKVPSLDVRVVGPKGELLVLHTDARELEVASLLANEPNAQAREATAPVIVMQDDYTLAWLGGGVLAIALIAVATLLIQRWLARRPKQPPAPPPPRPAWEIALEKLEKLRRKQEELLAEQRGEELIDGVSDAVREYLGKRYGFDGLESTSDETLSHLERLRPQKLSLSGVQLLLAQCDLVKFARLPPDREACDDLFNGALGIVRATTPASESPSAEAHA
jgi:hypothetical protein